MECPSSSLFLALFWPLKSMHLDIENWSSSIDDFLKSVPKFFSTRWNSRQVPAPPREKRYPEGVIKLDVSEINSVMRRLGVGYVMEDAEDETKIFGGDDFSTLFDEEEPSFDEIKETFDVFDSNKDGFIDCGELRRVLHNLGFRQGCDPEDCNRMIRDFDVNGDGLIDFREFVVFMEKCLSHT